MVGRQQPESHWSGEQLLVAAVLLQAVEDIRTCVEFGAHLCDCGKPFEHGPCLLYWETRLWFAESDGTQPWSFPWCCDVLGVDASAARGRVR